MHNLVPGRPHPRLRGLVSRYVEFSERAAGPVATLEPASADVVVVLDLADGWTIEQDGAPDTYASFAGGLHDGPTRVEHPGRSHGLQLDLTPLGARVLLGLPLAELAHRVVGLEDVLGAEAPRLLERLHSAGGATARFAVLDALLLSRLDAPAPRPDVVHAWRRLRETGGTVPIAALAAELRCSRRHLAATFRTELGLGPKAYARVLRFGRPTALLARGEELARVAAACGYADQPHLNREFRLLAGRPPVTFLQDRAGLAELASAP